MKATKLAIQNSVELLLNLPKVINNFIDAHDCENYTDIITQDIGADLNILVSSKETGSLVLEAEKYTIEVNLINSLDVNFNQELYITDDEKDTDDNYYVLDIIHNVVATLLTFTEDMIMDLTLQDNVKKSMLGMLGTTVAKEISKNVKYVNREDELVNIDLKVVVGEINEGEDYNIRDIFLYAV